MFTAKYGINMLTVEKTVVTAQDVYDAVQDLWNIPQGIQVRINNAVANLSDKVPEGATVEFTKTAGEKGHAPCVAQPFGLFARVINAILGFFGFGK